jgi:protein-disulfide isomerase/uncharacterized membrane protein
MARMSAKRAAVATIVLALVGAGISGEIALVHARLASSPGYVSFCNINELFSCDVVLSSEYSHFAGIQIAWWAMLAYAAIVAAAVGSMRASRASRRRQAGGVVFALAIAGALFSGYLAYVALFVLQAICILCSGLYVVNAALLVSSWLLYNAVRNEGRKVGAHAEAWQGRLIYAGAAGAVAVFVALASWEASGRGAETMNKTELVERDPEFSRWYMALPVAAASAEGGHRKGGAASVVIVEFSDFECGHCGHAFQNLKRVLPRFGNDVALVFHHFPLDSACNPSVTSAMHRYACLAAMAAECAGEQDRFWEYHDTLFANQSALDRQSLIGYADRLALDHSKFLACLDSDRPRRRIEADVREAARLGITSTPTFFLNGRTVAGALEPEKLEHAIRLERAAVQTAS